MPQHTCDTCGEKGHRATTCVDSYPGLRGALGVQPDTVLAEVHGISVSRVAAMRKRHGVGYAAFVAGVPARWAGLHPQAVQAQVAQMAAELNAAHTRPGKATMTTADGLLLLALDAHQRRSNRQADMHALVDVLDPAGVQVLIFSMIHNDVELRTQWMVKIRDEDLPVPLWLDVSFQAYEQFTGTVGEGKRVHTAVEF
jgi:hypothetical protein